MNANHRLINLFIPENRANQASIFTVAAANAFSGIEPDSAIISQLQRICWAYLGTGWVITGSTDHYGKSPLHTSDRFHTYTGFSQSDLILPSCAGKHAALATNTSFCVCD